MTSLPAVPTSVSARAVPVMVHGAAAAGFGADPGEGMDAACAGSGMSANINDAVATSTAIRFATKGPFPKICLEKIIPVVDDSAPEFLL